MERKPIILILTSKDEIAGESQAIRDAVCKIGTHNVVILSDDKYGSAPKTSRLDRLMDSGGEYQYILMKKDRDLLRSKFRPKTPSKRVNRIGNAAKRYRPEMILTLTPYAHHAAAEAKKKLGFDTPIVYLMPSFTVDKLGHDDRSSVFIVENADMKEELIKNGVRSKSVVILGLPFEITARTPLEIASEKQRMGLPRTRTVFVDISDCKSRGEVVSLLIDQGDIINLVVCCGDVKEISDLREAAAKVQGLTAAFITKEDNFDNYLSVCDAAVTQFDAATIYKCFKLGIPTIALGAGEQTEKDLNYLVSNGLIIYAKSNIDVVAALYRILQTDEAMKLSAAGRKWVEMSSLENIASYLVSFISI